MKNGRPALEIDKVVCGRIKEARKSAEMTQAQLADCLDVSVQSVKNWEQGINGTDDSTLKKIAEICDVDFVWLKNIQSTDTNQEATGERTTEKEYLGKKIGSILKDKRTTQVELAKHLGIDVRMVNRWIRQGVMPRNDYLYEIADFLGVSPDYLMGKTEDLYAKKYSIREFTTDELLLELKRRIEAP